MKPGRRSSVPIATAAVTGAVAVAVVASGAAAGSPLSCPRGSGVHRASTPGRPLCGIAAIQDQKMDSDALLVQGGIDLERLQDLRLPTYHQVCVLLLCQTRDVRHGFRRGVPGPYYATCGIQLLLQL